MGVGMFLYAQLVHCANETETEKWLLMVEARLPTPVVGGVPEYRLDYPYP